MSNKYLEKIAEETFKDRAKHTAKIVGGAIVGGMVAGGLKRAIKAQPWKGLAPNRPGEFVEGAASHLIHHKAKTSATIGLGVSALTPAKKKDN